MGAVGIAEVEHLKPCVELGDKGAPAGHDHVLRGSGACGRAETSTGVDGVLTSITRRPGGVRGATPT